jgi:hypothetical protein
MSIDPSGRGTDETGYAVTAHLGGKIFLLDFGGVQGGYELSSLEKLANVAKQYKVNLVLLESNFGDGAFTELIKPILRKIHHCAVEEKRSSMQKERRIIQTLEPIMMQHRLVVNKRPLERDFEARPEYSLTYQLTHITEERGCLKHDDRIDAVEMAIGYWIQILARDEMEEYKRYEEDEIQKEIAEFLSEMCGVEHTNNVLNNW